MRVWLDPNRLAVAPADGERRRAGDPRAEHPGGGRRARRAAGAVRRHLPAHHQRAGAADDGGGVRRHRRRGRPGTGQITRLRDVARLELGSSRYSLRSLLDNKPAVAIGIFQRPGTNALQASADVHATMERLKQDFPHGRGLPDRLRPDDLRARVDQRRGRTRCSRRSCSSCSWWWSSCRRGARRSSRWWPCRCR